MPWVLTSQPITDRFTKYSEEDRAADQLWDRYMQTEPYETHGGAHLHEMPPHVQRLVYDFARALKLNALHILVDNPERLPRARK